MRLIVVIVVVVVVVVAAGWVVAVLIGKFWRDDQGDGSCRGRDGGRGGGGSGRARGRDDWRKHSLERKLALKKSSHLLNELSWKVPVGLVLKLFKFSV